MPSPTCEVRDGAGAYQATTYGVDVTPGNQVTIRLASIAGVDAWSIQCLTTDGSLTAESINAGLTIDPLQKTATLPAPAEGKALRFQSLINGGIGPDRTAVASYRTTFCIYTLSAATGRRVIAVDETFESDPIHGYSPRINDLLRTPAGSGGSAAVADDIAKSTGTTIDRVQGLRGRPLSSTAPSRGDSYVYDTLTSQHVPGRPVPSGWIDVKRYGAVGNGTTDDASAINAAIQAAKGLAKWNGTNTAGATVYFPPGNYRCASQILVDGPISLKGAGSYGPNPASALVFDENLVVPENTLLRLKYSGSGGNYSQGLTVSELAVVQKRTAARNKLLTLCGIGMHGSFITLHNVSVAQIQGHGIEITSSTTDETSIADTWVLSGFIQVSSNDGHGIYVHGYDSSAGASVGVIDARSNGGYGVYETSFLGNYWAAIHTTSNGIWHADAVVHPGGNVWVCNSGSLIAGDAVPVGNIPNTSKPIWQPNGATTLGELCIPTWANNTWFVYRATSIGSAPNQKGAVEPTWPTTLGATVVDGNITWTCWREIGGAMRVDGGVNKSGMGALYVEGDQQGLYLATPAQVPDSAPYKLDARSVAPARATASPYPIEIQVPVVDGNVLDQTKSRVMVGLGRWGHGFRTPVGLDSDVILRWAGNRNPSTPNDTGTWLADRNEHEFRYRGLISEGLYRYEQRFRSGNGVGFQEWCTYQIASSRGTSQIAALIVPSLWIGNRTGTAYETRLGAVPSTVGGKPDFTSVSLSGSGYFPAGSILYNKDYPTRGPIAWVAKEDCGVKGPGNHGAITTAGFVYPGLVVGVTDGGVWVALDDGRDTDPTAQATFNALTSTPGATHSTGTITWKCVGTSSGNPNSWDPIWSGDKGRTTQAMADANQAAAQSVYEGALITTTGALTADRTLTLPSATDARAYRRTINNTCTGAFNIVVSTGAGTTVSIANGKTADVWIDSRGVTRLTADV